MEKNITTKTKYSKCVSTETTGLRKMIGFDLEGLWQRPQVPAIFKRHA